MTVKDLQYKGVANAVDRDYRSSSQYQWARELAQNGIEAEATRIEFQPEWQGVQQGVYRLMYSDDGYGMTKDQLQTYMSTLGEGGKSVGGDHENFAVGVRMTLLPWNHNGVIVSSIRDGEINTILMFRNKVTNSYCLDDGFPKGAVEDDNEILVKGIDVRKAFPDYVKNSGHGTIFILLGSSETEDTVRGDVIKGEQAESALSTYLNSRYFDISDNVRVACFSLHSTDKSKWPTTKSSPSSARWRAVRGLKKFVEASEKSGTVHLKNAKVTWFIRNEDYAVNSPDRIFGSTISVLYANELYCFASTKNSYNISSLSPQQSSHIFNSFGLRGSIKNRVSLIIEPEEYVPGKFGVIPETSRSNLRWFGVSNEGTASGSSVVKLEDFSYEFASNLPAPILEELMKEDDKDIASDEARAKKLMGVLSPYFVDWKKESYKPAKKSDLKADDVIKRALGSSQVDNEKGVTRKIASKSKKDAANELFGRLTKLTGEKVKKVVIPAGHPNVKWVNKDVMTSPNLIAQYLSPTAAAVNGEIYLNEDSVLIKSMNEKHVKAIKKNNPSLSDKIVKNKVSSAVRLAYEISALSRVSHISSKSGVWITEEEAANMLGDWALSGSLMGQVTEDRFIDSQLSYLRRKKA